MYITREQLRQAGIRNRKSMRATAPDGKTTTVSDIPGFCRKMRLNVVSVRNCAQGKQAHHQGWTFEYLEKGGIEP
jgi:hypothetical protein